MNDSIDNYLGRFVNQSQCILQGNLVGIYLHGSAVMGCFNPAKSDLDLLIVVNVPLSDSAKQAYMDMVAQFNTSGPAKGIELSIVTLDVCNPFVYPTPFDLHFSSGHLNWYTTAPEDYIQKMKGTDKDLAAHFTIINKRGKCIYGRPIADVFAEVPKQDYMDSIWNDIAEAPEDIAEDTMYLTLNLARVLAFKEDGLVLSKKEGGEWALAHVPTEFHPLIHKAMSEYADAINVDYNMELAKLYAGYMLGRIRQ